MESILQKIQTYKIEEVQNLKDEIGFEILHTQAQSNSCPRGFENALVKKPQNKKAVIAEIKKASPSKGLIRERFCPTELAKSYYQGGATCLSVLTDIPSFQGHNTYLMDASSAVPLPVLRKDFIIDPIQVVESRAIGADCILIIMAMVDDILASELEQTALNYGLDVLVEVHNEEEANRALKLQSNLLGINNRNLIDFSVSLDTTINLVKILPGEKIIISESGIFTREDLEYLGEVGVNCFLIGESLMREKNVQSALEKLL